MDSWVCAAGVQGAGAVHACYIYIFICRINISPLARNFHRVGGQPYHCVKCDANDDLTLQTVMVTENLVSVLD
jgi:hypothetical protein